MLLPDPTASAAFLADAGGNVITWNEGCEKLFGLQAAAIAGRPMCALLLDCNESAWPAQWAQLVQQAQSAAQEVELACAGGRSANATLMPQNDAGGTFYGCIVVTAPAGRGSCGAAQVAQMPLSSIVDMIPGTFYVVDREGRFIMWNQNLERVTEMTSDELAAVNVLDMFEVEKRPAIAEVMRKVFDEGAELKLESEYVSESGRRTPTLFCGARLDCDGVQYLCGVGIDASAQREREQQLRLRERALHAASNGIVITGAGQRDYPIEYVNPAFEHITGYRAAEVIGRDSRFMAAPGMDINERAQVRAALAEQRHVNVVFRNVRKNGDLFWNDLSITPVRDDHGQVTHFIGVIVDVTDTKQRTAHLEHEVNHDALTGLANRTLLWDRLSQALHLASRAKSLVATVLIDLNNFKKINDTFGHEAGDVVLKAVARRLEASVRDSDTVARMSGDEFVLVLVNQPSLRFTLRMIERLRQGLTMPVVFNQNQIPVGASIGVAVFPHDGTSATELVRAADVAMYHAKATGRDEVHFFSVDMKSTTEAKQRLEDGLRHALDRDELYLVYQPVLDLRSGHVGSFEALLRWRHPEDGVLLPAAFLAEAEESGLIVQIGKRVLDQAFGFLRQLRQLGFADLRVAVNASQREYGQHDFVTGIADRLLQHGLAPASVQIELREDGLIRNPGLGREVAAQLRALGLALSVDGFGDGVSDINYLQQLSATHVKLAKVVIHAIGDDGAGSAIAKTLIDIGHNLNIEVIGESVETSAQMEFLRSRGCDQIQGTWFCEPLTAEAAQKLLRDRPRA